MQVHFAQLKDWPDILSPNNLKEITNIDMHFANYHVDTGKKKKKKKFSLFLILREKYPSHFFFVKQMQQ